MSLNHGTKGSSIVVTKRLMCHFSYLDMNKSNPQGNKTIIVHDSIYTLSLALDIYFSPRVFVSLGSWDIPIWRGLMPCGKNKFSATKMLNQGRDFHNKSYNIMCVEY